MKTTLTVALIAIATLTLTHCGSDDAPAPGQQSGQGPGTGQAPENSIVYSVMKLNDKEVAAGTTTDIKDCFYQEGYRLEVSAEHTDDIGVAVTVYVKPSTNKSKIVLGSTDNPVEAIFSKKSENLYLSGGRGTGTETSDKCTGEFTVTDTTITGKIRCASVTKIDSVDQTIKPTFDWGVIDMSVNCVLRPPAFP